MANGNAAAPDTGNISKIGTDSPSWIAIATRPSVVRRGLMYAVIVGAILIAINHGDALLRGEYSVGRLLKMALTVTVPYVVSTLSSVGAIRAQQASAGAEASA